MCWLYTIIYYRYGDCYIRGVHCTHIFMLGILMDIYGRELCL